MERLRNYTRWGGTIFWTWNGIFLAFMLLGFGPTMLPEMINAVRTDWIPPDFLLYAALLMLTPVLAVAIGWRWLRRDSERLFTLGYGVEGPLMILLALRFFVIRELTAGVALLLVTAVVGMLTLLWHLLDRQIDERPILLQYTRFVGLSLLIIIGFYVSAWLAFYVVPLASMLFSALGDFSFWENLGRTIVNSGGWVVFVVLAIVLLAFSVVLVILFPIVVPIIYLRAWWASVQAVRRQHGPLPVVALPTALVAGFVSLFAITTSQPQQQAFALLAKQPTSTAEAVALLDQQELIRAGLLNAYLAPRRYVSAEGGIAYLDSIYRYEFGLNDEQIVGLRSAYELFARPLLYKPVNTPDGENFENHPFVVEPVQAAKLYHEFFDQPIEEGERAAVEQAARSTWSFDQAQRAWQEVSNREIHLLRQELNITEQGDWAEMELYEVYQNQTGQRQEVIYYFNLPESAVITGLWLGNSPDRVQRFAYRISPRGAAQQAYQNEVRRNVDPALVEQIGPRQYRLRVFPVEPEETEWDDNGRSTNIKAGPPLHMWMTWRVLAGNEGWPLPQLAEGRNVYWDSRSTRLLNGAPMVADEQTWLPALAPFQSVPQRLAHRVDFPDGRTVLVRPVEIEEPRLNSGTRIALVLDRSRSMAAYTNEIRNELEQLRKYSANQADIYLTAAAQRGEGPSRVALKDFDPGEVLYFGGQDAGALLNQYEALRNNERYDLVLVLTDASGYSLGESKIKVSVPDTPLWLIHINNRFPPGYDDDTLAALQGSGGGVAGSIEEALTRYLAPEGTTMEGTSDVIDGYLWQVLSTASAPDYAELQREAPPTPFAAFAARRLIVSDSVTKREQLGELATLDGLHAIATQNSIVTPYSSMIVLINEQQEQMLDQLEKRNDRFIREVEKIGDTNAPTITGVPEPEEWLLIGIGAALLGWYLYRGRRHGRGLINA
jgi:putative PEP-CTERM system integral membrane protein